MTDWGKVLPIAVWAVLLLAGCPEGDEPSDDDTAADDDDTGDDDTSADDDDSSAAGDDDSAGDDDDPPLAELIVGCPDTTEDVYVWPDYLPPWGEEVVGDPVRCAVGEELDVMEVADRLVAAGVDGIAPWSGVRTYLIAYRTTRWEGADGEGVEGMGTARVYLPDTLIQGGPRPVVVLGHDAVGIGDTCAPTHVATHADAMALPWVGRGFSVIAPDYAGLGNAGLPGYRHTADTAHSALDADRALRKAVVDGALGPGSIHVGIDQGGGAALGAHALAPCPGTGTSPWNPNLRPRCRSSAALVGANPYFRARCWPSAE